MASKGSENSVNINDDDKKKKKNNLQKSYFDVLGLCCSSEVPLIEKILRPLEGVIEVSVIVPTRTVIVLHDNLLISPLQIVKALNQARLEANIRVIGKASYRGKWPSPYVIISGALLGLSFLKYVYQPFQWLAVAAVAVGIWPVLLRGVVAVRNFTLDVNILMLIAVVGTIAMRDYPEAGTIVFLFTIAEWLESRASHKATAVMSSLMSMAPQKATIAETGEEVSVEDVNVNTILAVKAGEMIPIDGIVVEGTCEVDEKTLTGESYPVAKQKDSIVWAGTVNVNGYVSVKTTALAEDCAVAKMAKLVEEAQNNKSSVQRLIDRCAKYYTPAVVLISAGLALVPIIFKLHDLKHWFYLALVVLVSACPCGLILSTPVATFCALSRAATSGLLIKGGDYLEILAKIKVMAFDKTGTITRGEFTLMDFQTLADDVSLSTLLYWVSSIESKSSHPIAAVLVDYGRSQSIEPKPENVEEFQDFPGEGVLGKIDGRDIYIGNQRLGQRANCRVASNSGGDTKRGKTPVYVYSGSAVIGTFSLSDNCRSGATDAIKELKSMGIRTALLTGDGQSAALHAQEQLGNALDVVHAELLPEDKARIIQDYRKEGPTAMVGDGVNDAPALATADIGISMGVSGSALATETGNVILMSNDIRKIPKAIKLARKTRRKVIENIVFSITTKAAVLAVAFAGHPLVWLAVLVDVFTCLIVILNSMLLLRGSNGRGRKCFGLFSCHSHKSKCHSSTHHHHNHSLKTNHQQCCSQNTPAPKSSCVSQKHESHCHTDGSRLHLSKTSQPQCCSQNTPALKSSCVSQKHVSHCHTDGSLLHLSKTSQKCCSKSTPDPRSCESLKCPSSQKHSVACQTDSKCHLSTGSSECCSAQSSLSSCSTHRSDHHVATHNPCEKPFSGHALESQSKSQISTPCEGNDCGQTSDTCQLKSQISNHHSTCCNEDHCLDLLESQESCEAGKKLAEGSCCDDDSCEAVKHEEISECVIGHSDHHHHHHHETKVCNEGNKDHCASSHFRGNCHANQGIWLHGTTCHGETVAKHVCSSLRKREVGACCKSFRKECCSSGSSSSHHGHFAAGFGGLTEIVTE